VATVVIGGHSRNVGKTSVVAGLIAALPEYGWTAVKITQFGHGVCSVNGESCDCATDEHTWSVSEEKDASSGKDTARYLASGAKRSLWVRTKQGRLAEAMPDLRRELGGTLKTTNVIIESNSVLRFLRPDIYLTVLDPNTADFKESSREFLDRADAVLLHAVEGNAEWERVSLKPVAGRPVFEIRPPEYVNKDVVEFVRAKLATATALR
jgi:molybdopterin-guanine dinucleotide biosynthesis protein